MCFRSTQDLKLTPSLTLQPEYKELYMNQNSFKPGTFAPSNHLKTPKYCKTMADGLKLDGPHLFSLAGLTQHQQELTTNMS